MGGTLLTQVNKMRPRDQLAVGMLLYIFHLKVLTQHALPFPFQLIPNEHGRFQSIGLDSLAGIFSLLGFIYYGNNNKSTTSEQAVPTLWSSPTRRNAPWRFPRLKQKSATTRASGKQFPLPGPRSTGVIGFLLLVQAYFLTGRFSLFWEDFLYAAAGVGFEMTKAMHRSLCVLFGHLSWITLGATILRIVPRPQPFFYSARGKRNEYIESGEETKLPKYKWYTNTWNTNWLWWTVGGYFVSAWMFNLADFVNQMVLPAQVFEAAAEGVVSQLINPEHNDLAASIVGCIAPCLTAPWWEEILYRGFMLPAMCLHLPFWTSVVMSGIVFSAHHLSATGAIPLAVLGWTWAAIYAKSGNLLVTILIHAMWNSRVFLGSWLGL